MLSNWVGDVLEFHKQIGLTIGEFPHIPDSDVLNLRRELVREEYEELMVGLYEENLTDIADASIDLIYVLIGMLITMGVDPRPVWREVQRANLRKVGGPKREDGKVLKPDGWEPPNLDFVKRRLPLWKRGR
jgi:predicted HAD superfamily Cof-like phosphohydrolase